MVVSLPGQGSTKDYVGLKDNPTIKDSIIQTQAIRLRTRGNKLIRTVNNLPTGGTTRHERYNMGSFDSKNMLMCIKDLALEPWKMKSSHQRLRNQILKFRRHLITSDAKSPQRKRKFNQYMNDGKFATTFESISREKYGNQNAKSKRRVQHSSLSCSPLSKEKFASLQGTQGHVAFPALNDRAEYCSFSTEDYSHLCQTRVKYSSLSYSPLSKEKCDSLHGMQGHVALPALNDRAEYCSFSTEDYSHLSQTRVEYSYLSCSPLSKEKCARLQGTQGHVAFPALNDRAEYCRFSTEDYSHLSDSTESINWPNPLKQGNVKNLCKDLVTTSGSYTHSTEETSIKEKPNIEFLKVSKSVVNEDFDDSSKASNSLSSQKEDMELNQPLKKFLASRGNHLPRPVIPIGPRFQAEIPKWEGQTNKRHYNNSDDDLRWLGTQIWPMPITAEKNTKGIKKGRPESCSCDFLGSVDCVQQHISETRELLQSKIVTAF